MVASSELVVLLIVCVGINTGSAQQGELATSEMQLLISGNDLTITTLIFKINNSQFKFHHEN